MPVKFALPIGHKSAVSITPGRSFHQPVDGAPSTSVPGIELVVAAGVDARLYAPLAGTLFFGQATTSRPERLLLFMHDSLVYRPLLQTQNVESPPTLVIFENVDIAEVEAAVGKTIEDAFQGAQTLPFDQWHPSMREVFLDGTKPKSKPTLLFDYINAADNPSEAIADFVNFFVTSPTPLVHFSIAAGDWIGTAAGSGATRQVVFQTLDASFQAINPLNYLHQYINASPAQIELLSSVLFLQPWFTAFPALQNPALADRPQARELVTIPSGDGQFQFSLRDALELTFDPDSDFPASLSQPHKRNPDGKIRWFYEAGGSAGADTVGRLTVEGEGHLAPSPGDRAIVRNQIWSIAGTTITELCTAFQVPCETVVGVVAGESQGRRDTFVFLPMPAGNLRDAAGRPDLLAKYDALLGNNIVSYRPTRLSPTDTFGTDVVTAIDGELAAAEDIPVDALEDLEGSHFFVDQVYQPVIYKHVKADATNKKYRFDVSEERLGGSIDLVDPGLPFFHPASNKVDPPATNTSLRAGVPAFADVAFTANRPGRVRVIRVRRAGGADVQLTVGLFVANDTAPALSVTLAPGETEKAVLTGTVDAAKNDRIAIKVEAAEAVTVDVEWYLGFKGADGAPVSPGNMSLTLGFVSSASGLFNPIPEPFNGDAKVRNDRDITWGEIATLLDLQHGDFMVVGFMQTMISVAFDTLKNQLPGFANHLFADLNITPPATRAGYITTGFMLDRRNAAFVGLAIMRLQYRRQFSWFDLPLVSGAFFQSFIKFKAWRWGINLPQEDWGDVIGRRYNAMLEAFFEFENNTTTGEQASVRFRR